MRNLELKVRCPDEATLEIVEERARQNKATYIHTLQQRDTYFNVPSGRLKLREWSVKEDARRVPSRVEDYNRVQEAYENGTSGALLIAYTRPNEESSRISDYLISPISDPKTFLPLLTTTLGTWMIIEKTRVLYRYGRTRIHLDRVIEIGSFVELESEFAGASSNEGVTAEHEEVKKFLQLDVFPTIAYSYSDLK
ncbi:MAG: CYTH domain-containing protein [Ktedonobacteraceae bacterium]|nr:CYTH domain-containing protein [Ktedonobacteraceae bacterium]